MKEPDTMHDDPANWKMGIFYYNPQDKRLLLPKKNPNYGLTFNWAKPWTYVIMGLFVVFVIAFIATIIYLTQKK